MTRFPGAPRGSYVNEAGRVDNPIDGGGMVKL